MLHHLSACLLLLLLILLGLADLPRLFHPSEPKRPAAQPIPGQATKPAAPAHPGRLSRLS